MVHYLSNLWLESHTCEIGQFDHGCRIKIPYVNFWFLSVANRFRKIHRKQKQLIAGKLERRTTPNIDPQRLKMISLL